MAQAFALLLLAQLLGEGVVHALSLPVPGPVAGLLLMALALLWRERSGGRNLTPLGETDLGRAANGLLGHLSLLFVPAAVGVVQQGAVLAENGALLVVAIVISTVLTLAVTAGAFTWALRFVPREGDRP